MKFPIPINLCTQVPIGCSNEIERKKKFSNQLIHLLFWIAHTHTLFCFPQFFSASFFVCVFFSFFFYRHSNFDFAVIFWKQLESRLEQLHYSDCDYNFKTERINKHFLFSIQINGIFNGHRNTCLFYKLWWVLNAENYPKQKNKEKNH